MIHRSVRTPVVCLLAGLACLAASPASPWSAAFDQVWTTVRDKHWNRALTGETWNEARERFRPLIAEAADGNAARRALQEMLDTLGQSHFNIIPREAYRAWEEAGAAGDAAAGVELRIMAGVATVYRVGQESPAAAAGVRPGWTLPVQGLEGHSPLAQWVIASRALQGAEGEQREFTFDSGDGRLRTMTLAFRQPAGRIVRFGNLPPLRMEIERRRLPGGAVYLRWSAFFEPEWLNSELATAISDCGRCPGLVLDLRGNLGGIAALSATVTGWLVDSQSTLGTLVSVAGNFKMVAFPRPGAYAGNVAVLVDGLSMSTSEFLAAGLQDLKRARLFGQRTYGAALPSNIERLPTGDGFQYATANYISAGGRELEGRGVEPDVAVPLTRNDLLSGRDAVLDAAQRWLAQEAH